MQDKLTIKKRKMKHKTTKKNHTAMSHSLENLFKIIRKHLSNGQKNTYIQMQIKKHNIDTYMYTRGNGMRIKRKQRGSKWQKITIERICYDLC